MKTPLTQNKSYQATAKLNAGLALFATPIIIASKLQAFGFTDVQVTGKGTDWQATGKWARPSQEVELPKEIVEFKEV